MLGRILRASAIGQVVLLSAVLAWTPTAAAQTEPDAGTGTSTVAAPTPAVAPAVDVQTLKDDLRRELREELRESLKAEIKEELAQEEAVLAPVEEDDWADADWSWEEPAEPKLNFLEMHGYFRVRWDLFWKLDLDTFAFVSDFQNPSDGFFGPYAEPFIFNDIPGGDAPGITGGVAAPVPICRTDVGDGGCAPTREDDPGRTLAGANMRFRFEPTLNVYEDIKIHSQIDVFDNVILGSTPDSLPFNPISPLSVFSNSAISPSDGFNSVWSDAIRVKRLWGEVTLPFGMLRFGRQPNHFGMGILANDGAGLDADFGDNVDRVQFAVKLGDFYIMPSYDWLVSGPSSATRFDPVGQPFDRGERDDAEQWTLILQKRDADEVVDQKLQNDKVVWHAGFYGGYRRQPFDSANFFRQGTVEEQATESDLIFREAELFLGSLWGKLRWRKLTLEAEYAFLVGSLENGGQLSQFRGGSGQTGFDPAPDRENLDLNQHGMAFRGQYKFLKDKLSVDLLVAFASGDDAPGWGVRPLTGVNTSRFGSVWDGNQAPGSDPGVSNYRFNPAFVFDMILWRQLVGTLTDGLVIRPSVQYAITKEIGARLDIVYSRSIFGESTPSGSFLGVGEGSDEQLLSRSPDNNLGVEFDVKLFYDSDNGFHFWLEQGFFIPMDGLDRVIASRNGDDPTVRLNEAVTGPNDAAILNARVLNSDFAYTLQLMFGITF